MAITQTSKIQSRSGKLSDLPQLSVGELGFATDTKQLFIGNDSNTPGFLPDNTEILTVFSDIPAPGINTDVVFNNNGVLGAANVDVIPGINPNTKFTYDYLDGNVTANGGRGLLTVNNANITDTMTVTSLDAGSAIVRGDLEVLGNITFVNERNLSVDDPVIIVGANVSGSLLANFVTGVTLGYSVGGSSRQAFMGYLPVGATSNATSPNTFVLFSNSFVSDSVANGTLADLRIANLSATGTISGIIAAPGSNTQVIYNNNGVLDSFTGFTFNQSTNTVTSGNAFVSPNVVASTSLTTPTIVQGSSNIRLDPSGNVTISSAGTSNVFTVTSTGVNVAGVIRSTGNITTSANANVGNLNAVGGVFTGNLTTIGNITGGNISTAGNISGGNLTLTGSLTMPAGSTVNASNITATGTITGGNLATGGNLSVAGNASVIGNIAGGNISTAGSLTVGANAAVTGNLSAGNISTVGTITATSTITGGNLATGGNLTVAGNTNLGPISNVTITGGTSGQFLQTNGSGALTWATISTSGISNGTSGVSIPTVDSNVNITVAGTNRIVVTTAGANIVGGLTVANITTGANTTAGTFTGDWTLTTGSRLNATYADIAERYTSDSSYPPGTVVMIGGEKETTIANFQGRHRLAGIVSTEPAYILNSTIGNSVIVALTGRVPCLVTGNISKGDMLTISNIDGVATASTAREYGTVIGRALESYNSDSVGTIEVKVDRG